MAVLHYSFHSHPKIVKLPKATIGVYALALSYASGNLTDGFVPDDYARHLDAKRQHFGRLIAAGLVDKRPDGYALRDYLDYNPSKAEVEQKRKEARERMTRVRANKPAKQPQRSREQDEPVTPNVRDIGLDQPSLEATATNHVEVETQDVRGAATTRRAQDMAFSNSNSILDILGRKEQQDDDLPF